VGGFLIAGGSALRVAPGVHYPGRLVSRFWQGFIDFYDVKLPFDPAVHRNMHGAILLGIFAFALGASLAIAARRTRLAGLTLLVGAGWPATLLGGGELFRGALLLAGLLTIIAGLSGRRRSPGLAVAAGAAVVLIAVLASSTSALARGGFINWQSWDFYTHPGKPVSVTYVWDSSYSGLTFPRKPTVVLRIKAPGTPEYWRTAELSTIVNGHWIEDTTPQTQPSGYVGEPGLVAPGANRRSNLVEQAVTVEGLSDTHLTAAEIPVRFDPRHLQGVVAYDPAGEAFTDRGLHRGDSYRAWSYLPQPTPNELARSRPVYPQLISIQRKYLEVEQRTWVPPFGAPHRVADVEQLFVSSPRSYRLRAYRPLFSQAERVAGDAKSPYAATVALESWFRSGGGFVYDQHPPFLPTQPALVYFATRSKAGYCQHFAGAMALMLRYLGIPARVAAGFSSGRYDSGQWVVTDQDAHEWVEVWFRGWGWLPFDPTPGGPGGSGLAGGYSASSKAFDLAAAAAILAGKEGLRKFAQHAGELGFARHNVHVSPDVPDLKAPHAAPVASHSHTPGLLRLLLLVVAGLCVAIVSAKLVIRRSRYLTRDPRRLASACRRELRDMLLDQLVDVPDSATLEELASLLEAEFGIEAASFGLHASAARFGPPSVARVAAREMRRSLRQVRRDLRSELTRLDRTRGLLSLRSLGLA
jgi:transglutaminase-like putative cysteine protease